jgi:eukaryotic-like serine/threonine-protein kinase
MTAPPPSDPNNQREDDPENEATGVQNHVITPPAPAARESSRPSITPSMVPRADGSGINARLVHSLRIEEAQRIRGFARIVSLLSALALVCLPWLGGVMWSRLFCGLSLLILLLVSMWVWVRAQEPKRYSPKILRIFGITCVVSSIAIDYYFGVFSPVIVVLNLGISFFGMIDDSRHARRICFAAIGIHFLLAIGVLTGVVHEYGLLSTVNTSLEERIFMLFMIPIMLSVTYWQSRINRGATHQVLKRLQEATHIAWQRKAQLDEANQQLDMMIHAGKKSGRYSEMYAGYYLLGEVIGRGAMGEVYAAEHIETKEPAAAKLLHSSVLETPELLQRFLQEGQITSQLVTPYIVKVFEIGEAEDGAPFIAMELLVGHDLSWHLRRKHQLGLHATQQLVHQVCQGLSVAHEAGVVHRDLKPQNLFLAVTANKSKIWKILDFGVCKHIDQATDMTHHGLIGTPSYMSPELARGQDADVRSDIFSLAAVVYRVLTGRLPFLALDTPQVLFEIMYRMPESPRLLVPTLPGDLELFLAIALAKKPKERWANVNEFSLAFERACKQTLPESDRRRAHQLLAHHPWGKLEPSSSSSLIQAPPRTLRQALMEDTLGFDVDSEVTHIIK